MAHVKQTREEIQYMDPRSLHPYDKNPRNNKNAIPMVGCAAQH